MEGMQLSMTKAIEDTGVSKVDIGLHKCLGDRDTKNDVAESRAITNIF